MKPFPIAVVDANAAAEETVEYLPMPHDMAVFRMPIVDITSRPAAEAAHALLADLLEQMRAQPFAGPSTPAADLRRLDADALAVANESLGQGEVSAVVKGEAGSEVVTWRIEESAFASLWHILGIREDGSFAEDRLEVAPIPAIIRRRMAAQPMPSISLAPPAGVMNSPAILAELLDQAGRWQLGRPAHIVNLSLLPVNPTDLDYLAQALGQGPVTVLSRGYGNCRLTSTALPNTWWVQYFNSMDALILNTIEVVDVPEAALAAAEDCEDSIERLAEWLDTLLEDC
jgi:hydrogenase-1 operon protein HyaF